MIYHILLDRGDNLDASNVPTDISPFYGIQLNFKIKN